MNVYEGGPTPPKVRVTKKQLRQIQENLRIAQTKAKDFSEQEKAERELADRELEQKLNEII